MFHSEFTVILPHSLVILIHLTNIYVSVAGDKAVSGTDRNSYSHSYPPRLCGMIIRELTKISAGILGLFLVLGEMLFSIAGPEITLFHYNIDEEK